MSIRVRGREEEDEEEGRSEEEETGSADGVTRITSLDFKRADKRDHKDVNRDQTKKKKEKKKKSNTDENMVKKAVRNKKRTTHINTSVTQHHMHAHLEDCCMHGCTSREER
jgi:hypothetical protein